MFLLKMLLHRVSLRREKSGGSVSPQDELVASLARLAPWLSSEASKSPKQALLML